MICFCDAVAYGRTTHKSPAFIQIDLTKYFNNFKRQYWNCGFWLANKFRHFLVKNKFLNNLFNILISYLIIILCIPFKSALKIKKSLGDNIDFSIEKSRLIL